MARKFTPVKGYTPDPPTTTFMQPGYRRTSRGHMTVNGVGFSSYSVGTSAYALISDDGQIFVARNYRKTTYHASVMIGGIATQIGDRYHTERAAMIAAIKVDRS